LEDLAGRDVFGCAQLFSPMPARGIQVAAAVRVFNQTDRRRHDHDFGHAQVAAEDAPKAVAGADFRRGDDGSGLSPALSGRAP